MAYVKQMGLYKSREWYSLRPILGNANWAIFYLLLGGRESGKSYSVTDFFVSQWKTLGVPFYWLRLTEAQARKLLSNNAEKLIDPDIRRRWGLDLMTSGNNVYEVTKRSEPDANGKTKVLEKRKMASVYALSTFYADKGSVFDKDFLADPKMRYNVAVDEFEREKGEKRTFDILYALVGQLENLLRSTKERTKIFFLGNTLEEASDVLCAFGFIPEEFGVFKLKKKRCVIHNIAPSDAYKARRKGTIADILMPDSPLFTNSAEMDKALIDKRRLRSPSFVIRFSKDKSDWFTVWDDGVIKAWCGEAKPVIAMKPYLDAKYDLGSRNSVIARFDARAFRFRSLMDFRRFQACLESLRRQ